MSTEKLLSGAISQLRTAAQKAATEEIKKIAAVIIENQKGIRLAEQKAETIKQEHQKNIEAAQAKADQIIAEFEADWGPWDSKPEAVVN